MRAVVTGGTGFIGSHIVDALSTSAPRCWSSTYLSGGMLANLEPALGRGAQDVRDGLAVDEAFQSFRPERVFHLAAQIDVRVSMDEPAHDAAVNVLGR